MRRSWFPEFEWDEANEQKLLDRRDISAAEVEECFANPHLRKNSGDANVLLGKTDGGRMLFLVYEQKTSGVVRVFSGREMEEGERRTFRRHVR